MTSMVEDKTNIAFGIIPNGIGNDFAKYWGGSVYRASLNNSSITKYEINRNTGKILYACGKVEK